MRLDFIGKVLPYKRYTEKTARLILEMRLLWNGFDLKDQISLNDLQNAQKK